MAITVLLHTTYSEKIGSIMAHGFRVSKRTKRGTAYDDDGKTIDEERLEAYMKSEHTLEAVREEMRPDLPSRLYSTFFQPPETNECFENSRAASVSEDERGKPRYDFGCGRDAALVVDARRIQAQGAIGDTALSDAVFGIYWREAIGHPADDQEYPMESARKFWESAKLFDASADYPENLECPEIWYPGTIPPTVITCRYDSNHPLP
ncbi:MAG: hypothetical protein JRN62_03430 [Nitrososphaerota archaeon]|jgi:hypothetical protein|nr:hypothetical protein [Nitrososphaerota archaeon]MDG6948651.1 hypothetical protein [Nitrososphaerota archaeon]